VGWLGHGWQRTLPDFEAITYAIEKAASSDEEEVLDFEPLGKIHDRVE